VTIWGKVYPTDAWYNLSSTISDSIGRLLHLQKDHPVSITRQIIESKFPSPTYKHYNDFPPVVSTHQNFDSLGFPLDHLGRSRADTYYINKKTVLRTHTSAHQADIFRANESEGFLISADVYRRDAIDRNHFPVFHQMEGARMWARSKVPNGDIVKAVYEDLENLPKHNMKIEDPNPPFHVDRNPLQTDHHTAPETEAVAAHLKRSLELVVVEVFSRAREASMLTTMAEPLKVRWIEAYFPFTSPSWELEIFWQGDWLEVLGCGVVKQDLLNKAGVSDQMGWAFGVGLERIAMLLFDIPDIRLFWSKDQRFTNQFEGLSDNLDRIKRFSPFSKHPACYKDVAFWLCSPSLSAGNGSQSDLQAFHENDLMELVRDIGGILVENVTMVDEFTHPKTSLKSLCYRISYRSLERTLTNEEVNELHELVRQALVDKLGVELR
jgi:phenylalanyl-tRNA synthetase alpha chain